MSSSAGRTESYREGGGGNYGYRNRGRGGRGGYRPRRYWDNDDYYKRDRVSRDGNRGNKS